MKNIVIHEAEIKDCYEIAVLKRDVWNTTYRGIYPDTKLDNYDIEENAAKFEKIIANPDIFLFVARDSDRIVGYMSCGKPYRPFQNYEQEIGLLYILNEYQNLGIGKELFSTGFKKIKQSGYNEFFISCNKYNLNALEFYKKMGGKVIHIDEDTDTEDKSAVQVKFHYQV